jgi:hypothetical protein
MTILFVLRYDIVFFIVKDFREKFDIIIFTIKKISR